METIKYESFGERMYIPINIFLNQSSYYEDLSVELFEIIQSKRKFYRRINNQEELKKLDEDFHREISRLIVREFKILLELSQANMNCAEDFGLPMEEKRDDEEE